MDGGERGRDGQGGNVAPGDVPGSAGSTPLSTRGPRLSLIPELTAETLTPSSACSKNEANTRTGVRLNSARIEAF